eukprot:754202-Hanusia_phi.AAC.3
METLHEIVRKEIPPIISEFQASSSDLSVHVAESAVTHRNAYPGPFLSQADAVRENFRVHREGALTTCLQGMFPIMNSDAPNSGKASKCQQKPLKLKVAADFESSQGRDSRGSRGQLGQLC